MNHYRATKIDAVDLYFACQNPDTWVRHDAYQALWGYLRAKLNTPTFPVSLGAALREESEDCIQEALQAIWLQLERCIGPQTPEKFLAWTTKILANKVVDFNRQAGYRTPTDQQKSKKPETACKLFRRAIGCKRIPRRCQVSLEALADKTDDDRAPYLERLTDQADVNPAHVVERQALLYDLLTNIFSTCRLNPNEKAVVWGSYLSEQTDHELAAQLNSPISTIRVTRKRALAKLRSNLQHRMADFFTPSIL